MELKMLALRKLKPGRNFTRINGTDDLTVLKESVRAKGVLFPLLVSARGQSFEVIDGNLRLAACRSLDWEENKRLPALVIQTDAGQAVEAALIANAVRAGDDPLAEAEAVNLLVNRYGRGAGAVARVLGKSDGYIRRLLRIYSLPPAVLESLRKNELTLTHAHWLTRLADKPDALAESLDRAVTENLSSRDLETLVANFTGQKEDSSYSYFSPTVVTTKAGSRLRFESRRRSVRVELNISPDEPIDIVLAEVKRNLKKLARGRLRVVG